jgi:site-specific recombinase XerD
MKGARPLNSKEIIAVSNQFDGDFKVRNKALFMLGVSVGGRISELLALTLSDVWQNGQPVSDLLFEKDVVKGKEIARMVPVNADGKKFCYIRFPFFRRAT